MPTKKDSIKFFAKIFLCISSCFLTIQNCVAATECLSDYEPANITQLAPNLFGVSPPYASFDPCNKSVVLNVVKNSTKLVIVMHGGAGGADSQAILARSLNKEGISTLFFDAFKMNKLYKDARWWAWNNITGTKQRMLYHSNLAAIKWLRKNTETAQMEIHLYGVSSGATAALNISSNEDLPYLKSVLIEGAAPMGIGLPDRLLKPVFFIFGAEDNYGGKTIDEYIWNRVVDCSFNVAILETPAGNAASCNNRVNGGNTIASLDSYIKQQKVKGANLSIKYYDGAGHDIFNGEIRRFRMNTPSGSLYATLGATGSAPDKLLSDILEFIKNQ